MVSRYVSYSDGACKKIGLGGCGAFLIKDNKTVVSAYSLSLDDTTNNQMELIGVILSINLFLQEVGDTRGNSLEIYTDSQYVVKGINEWIFGWIKKGWNTTTGPVANKDIWQVLKNYHDTNKKQNKIEIKWIKGHAGNPGNEVADLIASKVKYQNGVDAAVSMIADKIRKEYNDLSYPDSNGNTCLLDVSDFSVSLLAGDVVDAELLQMVTS